jgi:hypothetical protein
MDPYSSEEEADRVVAGTGAKALEREAVATRRAVVNMDFIVKIIMYLILGIGLEFNNSCTGNCENIRCDYKLRRYC